MSDRPPVDLPKQKGARKMLMLRKEFEQPPYTVEQFIRDSMEQARSRFRQIYPFHPGQHRHVWDRLIEEIEADRER